MKKKRGYHGDIEKLTLKNKDYRQVLYTAKHSQLVLMNLKPGEEIGMERHNNDQFFRIEKGNGLVLINGFKTKVKDGSGIIVPAGSLHNVINTSKKSDLKLYTIYSPPHHKDKIIVRKKSDEKPEHFSGKTTE